MRVNANNQQSIQIYDEVLEEVQEFTYLGSKMVVNWNVETEERIMKTILAFSILRLTWKSGKISTKTKLRSFQNNVISILLYGAESLKSIKSREN